MQSLTENNALLSSVASLSEQDKPNGALIFCRVIDNFGDAGVTWRLARRCVALGIPATLIIDNLTVLQKLAPELTWVESDDPLDPNYWTDQGVKVIDWTTFVEALEKNAPSLAADKLPDLVFETFGCRLPKRLEERLAERANDPRLMTVNLEYLSAEDWVENSHGIWGLHPSLPIKKLWFFPGFTDRTGGLIVEDELQGLLNKQLCPHTKTNCLKALGLNSDAITIFIFTYPKNELSQLVCALKRLSCQQRINLMLAPGAASDQLYHDLSHCSERIAIRKMPFVKQSEFDLLLRLSDVAFVRGEDSFARAQLNGLPLVWSIYPTEDDAHLIKLEAWLTRLRGYFSTEEAYECWSKLLRHWAHGELKPEDMLEWFERLPEWKQVARRWQESLLHRGDVVQKIVSSWQQKTQEQGHEAS